MKTVLNKNKYVSLCIKDKFQSS